MNRKRPALLVMALALAAPACGGEDEVHPTIEARPLPPLPAPPQQSDPAFTVSKLRSWYLIGNAATEGHDSLTIEVTAPPGVKFVDLWVDAAYVGTLAQKSGVWSLAADIKDLPPGQHEVLLSSDSSKTAFAKLTFTRTHPLYVITTTDWDDADNSDDVLARQEDLRAAHPDLKITHFVGPYTFTDPTVAPDRREVLADWVKGMRDAHGDEIGLHIHPYCNFISTTTVPCRTEPSLAYATGDDTGYSVVISSYTEEEFTTILKAADALFVANGLGKPTSFRAGGWSADASTLRALTNAGYLADTSAVSWERLEEWKDQPGTILYDWNKEHWASIGETSQPYHPNHDDALSSEAPTLSVLEVPDNGALVDYVDAAEMIEILGLNWGGGALTAPKQLSVGYHPPNFSKAYKQRMDDLFTHVDQLLSSADKGPVVYTTLTPMALVWPVTK